MYVSFFGLDQAPFSIAPDPRYLYMSERHREALAHLLYGVGGGGGFVLLTGEIGAGKTTVCRCFLEQIPPRCNVAYIFNPKLTVAELLHAVCAEFRIPHPHAGPGSETVSDYVDPLNDFLLRTHAVGQNNVLIIDEAQNLSADVLEQLRLLTNLETNERKLLQIVLIGQPELRDMLARPELEQLAQRVIARFHLQALSQAETAQYVQHRLGVAGLTGALPFDRGALACIHQLARGVPRRINLLCDRALLGAYASGQARVGRAIVERAAREVFGTPRPAEPTEAGMPQRLPAPPLAWLAAGAAGALALLAGLGWAWQAGGGPGPGRGAQVGAASAKRAAAPASAGVRAVGVAATGLPVSAASGAAPSVAAAGSAPRAAASAPAAAASAATVPAPIDLPASLAGLPHELRPAWRELLPLWGLPADAAEPCRAAARAQVLCDSHPSSLPMIRLLDRPGLLTLYDPSGRPAYALLTGLGAASATLRIGGVERELPLAALAGVWRGEFSTLWRTPPGYGAQRLDNANGSSAAWLGRQLAGLDAPAAAASGAGAASAAQAGSVATAGAAVGAASAPLSAAGLKSRIAAFQVAQGLPPDGLAGPFTLMQLNRATGVDEPRLNNRP